MSALAALLAAIVLTGCSTSTANDASSISRTISRVAGAGVVGVKRTPGVVCAPMAAADPSPWGDQRMVRHKSGNATVPADPQRIVVLDSAALDATCGSGMWERVVGAVTIDSPDVYGFTSPQPRYLGAGIGKIPSVGVDNALDLAKIRSLEPDLILGVNSVPPSVRTSLNKIAPTVIVDDVLGWKGTFQSAAAAMGRENVAKSELATYLRQAQRVATDLNTTQTQASVIRFRRAGLDIVGPETFAGSVLIDARVQRPPGQRDTSHAGSANDPEFAEGDCIYVMFSDSLSQYYAAETMRSDAWTDLGASRDRRVFAVDRQIWEGNGIIAARALLDDLRESLNSAVYD